MGFLFFKEVYQFLAIVVSGIFELFYEPLIYAVYGFFEGIDIHIFFVCDGNVIFGLPAAHDLFVAGTVDVTLIFNGFLSAFINNGLLLWCQCIVQVLVNAEEQTVVDCIPHGTVWLYFLYAASIAGRGFSWPSTVFCCRAV